MVATNYAKEQSALNLAGSGTTPQFLRVGTGSAAVNPNLGSLVTDAGSAVLYITRDISTARKVKYTAAKSSVAMSGLSMTEFGMGAGSVAAQDLWNREGFAAVNFDGTIEAEFENIFEYF